MTLLEKEKYLIKRLQGPEMLGKARQLIREHHYSGTVGTVTRAYGLFERGNEQLLGVAWWFPPSKPTAEHLYPDVNWKRVLSLSRLCVHPDVPKNAASFLIAYSIRDIRKTGQFDALVTYADGWRGHQGAIYRATNWEYVGETPPYQVWWNENLKRTRSNRSGSVRITPEMMLADGYVLLGAFPKHKFRMRLRE